MSDSQWPPAPHRLRELGITWCPDCGRALAYPRSTCPACGAATVRRHQILSGVVVALTTVHRAPAGFESWLPYEVALVACGRDVRVLARADGVRVGDDVRVGLVDLAGHAGVPVAIAADGAGESANEA